MNTKKPDYFSVEHLQTHSWDAPITLSEEAVHCLELVAELVRAGLRFQFKGGNSLLLILDTPRRFSIDVDIATDESPERIEAALDTLVKNYGVFYRWEKRQHKTKPWLPMRSYYLFFKSKFERSGEVSIMLDAQLRKSPYPTEQTQVVCGNVFSADELVDLPLPAGIIGDKLLTLGPNTLGIPVGKAKEAQRLKHVFDISLLMATQPDLDDIRTSLFACLKHENDLQQKSISINDILKDTLAFCATGALHTEKPIIIDSLPVILQENIKGLGPFANHLFAKDYSWQMLLHDQSRVGLCIAAACTQAVSAQEFLAFLAHANRDIKARGKDQKSTDENWNTILHWLGKKTLTELSDSL